MHSARIISYANNGNKYTGEWDGFIKGQGQINYKDGKKYIGQWDHYGGYKRHGLGTLYSADGQVLTGYFIKNVTPFHKKCHSVSQKMSLRFTKNVTLFQKKCHPIS